MALTNEQIKNLKPGDEVLINCSFNKIKENGDFQVSYLLTTVHGKLYWYRAAVHPSEVTIKSQPQHDPCRRFRKGDKVEPKAVNGRPAIGGINGAIIRVPSGQYFVARNEVENENYTVTIYLSEEDDTECDIDPAYLELIAPVEELEPYKVWDTTFSFNVGVEDSKAVFYYGADMSTCPYTREQAKAAAEAERDRLNEEYRKEHENGQK